MEGQCGVFGLAQCDTPSNAFKFVGSREKHAGIQRAGFWVAEGIRRNEIVPKLLFAN